MTSHRRPYRPHTFSHGTRSIGQRRRVTYHRLKFAVEHKVAEVVALLPRGFREYDLLP